MKKLYPCFRIITMAVLFSLIPLSLSAQLIMWHPKDVTECQTKADITVSFSVVLEKGVIASSYQWQIKTSSKLGVFTDIPSSQIPSAATSTLSLDYGKTSDLGMLNTDYNNYQFRCIVTSTKFSETSNSAVLHVYESPNILSHPSSATKNAGESITFSLSVSNSTPTAPVYQWQKNYINISGANSSSYNISSLSESDEGYYRCLITNSCGTSYSNNAHLSVNPLPEFPDAWSKQESSTDKNFRRIDALDQLNAAGVVNNILNTIKITEDGGNTWSTMSSTATSTTWYSIAYPSLNRIVVGGYNYINTTHDGGTTWTAYNFYDSLNLSLGGYLYDIEFIDSNTGFACGLYGLVMKTTDGGLNWTALHTNTSANTVTDANLNDIFFLNSNLGWAVGDAGVIIRTEDGGVTWTKVKKDNYLQGVSFSDANNGLAVASTYRYILKTTDGGDTWDQVPQENIPYFVPYGVSHTSASSAYVIGYRYENPSYIGVIAKTNDGGNTWQVQYTENADRLLDIDFADTENGWAAGYSGEMQRTASGGCFTPTVNLYADQSFCASANHLMVADTFSTNLNCSYLWKQDGTIISNNGSLIVNETGTYSVEVTSLCNVSASDTLRIFVFDLPEADAGGDIAICEGDSAQLFATGGVNYSWNNSEFLNKDNIQNPLASPPEGNTTFMVRVIDENGCEDTDEVMLTVHPIPVSEFSLPEFACGDQIINASHTGTAGIENFYWTFEDSMSSTGITTGNPEVSWEASNTGIKTISLAVEKNGCMSDTSYESIDIREIPESEFDAPMGVCGDDPAVLTYTGSAPATATYIWSTPDGTASGSGQGPVEVFYSNGGEKTIGLEVIQNECTSGMTEKKIMAAYPYNEEKICIVTVDWETGNNMVVWDKTPDAGISSYNIYRLGTGGIYNLIGNLPYEDFPAFVDTTGDPEKTQYLYKISAIDTCGNESDQSNYHKTLFLQYTSSDGGVNLLWQDYEIENESLEFSDFNIYRGTDSTDLVLIDVVSGSNVYTDTDAEAISQRMHYRVGGVLPEACDPAGILDKKAGNGPFVYSLSNLEDNRIKVGIENQLASDIKLQLYPNPFNQNTVLNYTLTKDSEVKIEVYNISGILVKQLFSANQTPGSKQIEITSADFNNQTGLYYIKVYIDNQYLTRKIILN